MFALINLTAAIEAWGLPSAAAITAATKPVATLYQCIPFAIHTAQARSLPPTTDDCSSRGGGSQLASYCSHIQLLTRGQFYVGREREKGGLRIIVHRGNTYKLANTHILSLVVSIPKLTTITATATTTFITALAQS